MTESPRLLSRAEAAAYCGYSPEHFSRLVAKGLFPAALPRIKRWDKAAIDRTLNELSGITPEDRPQTPEERYAAWEKEEEAREAQQAKEASQAPKRNTHRD